MTVRRASTDTSRAAALEDLNKYIQAWRRHNALMGVACLWDFAGALRPRISPLTPDSAPFNRTIAEAFREDWEAVGQSMWLFLPPVADDDYEEENSPVAVIGPDN